MDAVTDKEIQNFFFFQWIFPQMQISISFNKYFMESYLNIFSKYFIY